MPLGSLMPWSPDQSPSAPTMACRCCRLRAGENFLYELKAGPAGGRLRRPSSRRQHPWGRLTEAVRQDTSPAVAFVSITPRRPQMYLVVSVSTEQASRVRTRPEYCYTTKGTFF